MTAGRSATPAAAQRGLTRLELVVVVTLVVTLMALAGGYARHLAVRYERHAHGYDVNRIRAAVTLKFAELAMQGRIAELPRLVGANPLVWMAQPPTGYIGEFQGDARDENHAGAGPGSWLYNADRGELLYVLRHPPAGSHGGVLRYRLELAGAGAIPGLTLHARQPDPWR